MSLFNSNDTIEPCLTVVAPEFSDASKNRILSLDGWVVSRF